MVVPVRPVVETSAFMDQSSFLVPSVSVLLVLFACATSVPSQ